MGDIYLDKEKGVNPFLTYCQRCGGETSELVLMGNKGYVFECRSCGVKNYGLRNCQKCGSSASGVLRTLGYGDRVPASQPCDNCQGEIAEQRAVVAQGGVFFRCKDCGVSGVIKPSPFAMVVRKAQGAREGDPMKYTNHPGDVYLEVGVEFTKVCCPKCKSLDFLV